MTITTFLFYFGCGLVTISVVIALAYASYKLWQQVGALGAAVITTFFTGIILLLFTAKGYNEQSNAGLHEVPSCTEKEIHR